LRLYSFCFQFHTEIDLTFFFNAGSLEHVLNGRAVEMKTSLSSPMLSVQTSHRMNTPNRCALTPDVEQPASVTQRGKNRANQCPAWLQWVCLFQVPRPQHRKNRLNFY